MCIQVQQRIDGQHKPRKKTQAQCKPRPRKTSLDRRDLEPGLSAPLLTLLITFDQETNSKPKRDGEKKHIV